MTNHEKLIEELENGDDGAGWLMRPPVPGEGFCEDQVNADYQYDKDGDGGDSMSKAIGHYQMVQACDMCGSEDLLVKAVISENDSLQVAYLCNECGAWRFLQKAENAAKRTSTSLNHWAANVKSRDGYRCVICGSGEDIEAHHIIPVSNSRKFMYRIPNGITLCKKCHELTHRKE